MCMNTENIDGGQKPIPNDSVNMNYVSQMNIENLYKDSSSEDSYCSRSNVKDIVEFGPIKVKLRTKPALTLSTGRRSKYEYLTPEEDKKRTVRRARNREAAERVRINRLNIEQQLQNQIKQLEIHEQQLKHVIQILQQQKVHLQSRLFTHEKVCLITMSSNIPVQATKETTTINDNILDDFFSETPMPPVQNTDMDLLENMSPDDVEDYLINP